MGMQSRLLRVLESGEIVRLGANDPRETDVRFVSATNRDLKQDIQDGHFREDLYYRIRGTEIHIPALRQRREDIPLLVRHFVRKWASEIGRGVPRVEDATMLRLVAWDWPGNVRELANALCSEWWSWPKEILGCKAFPKRFRRLTSTTTAAICSLVHWLVLDWPGSKKKPYDRLSP